MEEDNDLARLLDQAAEPPVATPESFRDVMVRYRKGRTRALLAALAVVALLGPAAGVAVGRATAHHPVQVATGGPSGAATSDGSGGSVASMESRSGGSASPFQAPAPKRLFVRTTADGVTIRAFLQANLRAPGEAHCATDKGEVPCTPPPPECSAPEAQLQAELSDDGAVDPGFSPVSTAGSAGPVVVLNASYFGAAEGDPAAWVALKADAGVAQVRVRYSDGATDEMSPVDGYAVLAHRMAAPAPPTGISPASSPEEAKAQMQAFLPQGSAEALDATGAVVATVDLTSVTGPFSPKCAIGDPTMPPPPIVDGAVRPASSVTATTAPDPVPVPTTSAPDATTPATTTPSTTRP